jgi:hypothetical protein
MIATAYNSIFVSSLVQGSIFSEAYQYGYIYTYRRAQEDVVIICEWRTQIETHI